MIFFFHFVALYCLYVRKFTSNHRDRFVAFVLCYFKHEVTRNERAEGLSTSIKNPNEAISLVEKSTGFLFMLTCSDFLARLHVISELNLYFL